jgi:hypothetical protein
MLTNSSAEVFNADALLYGGAMLFLILVVHATYMLRAVLVPGRLLFTHIAHGSFTTA